jgi:hypothetical protein
MIQPFIPLSLQIVHYYPFVSSARVSAEKGLEKRRKKWHINPTPAITS